ncbi:IR3IP protein, partial [Baryphthengus martii]|nr:IR3IP protein [Baryphthengus martii]
CYRAFVLICCCVFFFSHKHLHLFLCGTVGWGSDQGIGGFGEEPGIKAQLTNLIRSVRTVMRVPLIAVNSITIVLLLLFG